MHVAADLNWFLQFVVFAFAAAFGLIYLVRNTASKYFVVDSNFDSSAAADYSSLDCRRRESMAAESLDSCAVCGLLSKKQCARCKMVRYCSEYCQTLHWNSEHKNKCMNMQSFCKSNHRRPALALRGRSGSVISVGGSSKCLKQSNKILFPYEDFVRFFSWDMPSYPPCGLLNCGNSCFANVVLQCLTYIRPLVAYLLAKGHRIECQRNEWCFLCEFQTHVERASRSHNPFSPVNILSRLPNIGGNLGYGKQEDAHEFMRFAIDTMQSVCLDEFGGEKSVHPSYQETTLIQHIFGGRLQSQVICAECNNVSNQFENMMDLTVEIHGDAKSLEECLDQFTAKERLHGDNMYKCDGCNAYVMAWKRLTIQHPPNILTIALKRFQSGRFGKLNKRVTFPDTLDLRPYMTESEDGNDMYKLYAVIVHVDMLNASFFGHYICYIKDFCGNWFRVDDCKVARVCLDEVLSQGAYMLLYSRTRARSSCLLTPELLKKEEIPSLNLNEACVDSHVDSVLPVSSANGPATKVECEEELLSLTTDAEDDGGDVKVECCSDPCLPVVTDIQIIGNKYESSSSFSVNPDDVNESANGFLNVSLLRKENHTVVCDVPEMAMPIDKPEAREEVAPPMSENIGQRYCLSSSSNENENQHSVKNSGPGSPLPKFKPFFARGFLEKTPRKKFRKPDDDKVGENGLLDEGKPEAVHENGKMFGLAGKPGI